MAKIIHLEKRVPVTEGVKVTVKDKKVRVEGPRGVLEKDFSHAKRIDIRLENQEIVVETYSGRKRDLALVQPIARHIQNMMTGVTKGWRYKLKIVYTHFPISVKAQGDRIIIENFLGQRSNRVAKIVGDTKVKIEKDDIILEGNDIEAVSQTAANIHLATHLPRKARLSPHGREGGPGVLDGIYVYEKGPIE